MVWGETKQEEKFRKTVVEFYLILEKFDLGTY